MTNFAESVQVTATYRPGGKSTISAKYGGRDVPFVILHGRIVDRAIGFRLLRQDLRDANQWISRAKEFMSIAQAELGQRRNKSGPTIQKKVHDKSELARALFVAALTFYGKAFRKSEGRMAKLSENDLDSSLRAAHTFFLSQRDAYAAHSGIERYEVGHAVGITHPNPKKARSLVVNYTMYRPNLVFEASDGKTFLALLEHAEAAAQTKIEATMLGVRRRVESVDLAAWTRLVQRKGHVNLDDAMFAKR